jgi:hypothetical protein
MPKTIIFYYSISNFTFAQVIRNFFDIKSFKVNHGANQATKSGYDPRRGTFQVICENFIKKGDQIFIEYGEKKDNTSLLLEYGFVMPNNPFDKIQISKTDLNEASQKYQNKFQLTRLATKAGAKI